MPLPYVHQLFFEKYMCEEKTKNINPEVDKRSKCFGEIFKGMLALLKILDIFERIIKQLLNSAFV